MKRMKRSELPQFIWTVYFCHLTVADRRSCLFSKTPTIMYEKQRFLEPASPVTFRNKPVARQCAADWPGVKDAIPGMNFTGDQVTLEATQEIGARKSRVVII